MVAVRYIMTHLCDSVGAPMATTEVRFQDLSIAATVAVGARSLPSLTNDLINMIQARDCEPLFATAVPSIPRAASMSSCASLMQSSCGTA